MKTFDEQYTQARAQMEGGEWKLRAEIATLEARAERLADVVTRTEHSLRYAGNMAHGRLVEIADELRDALAEWKA